MPSSGDKRLTLTGGYTHSTDARGTHPMSSRYALYYVPADGSPLGQFGAALFGRWPDGRSEADTLDLPQRRERVARVAHYGFHATLKAPFHLTDGATEQQLLDDVNSKTRHWGSATLDGLTVSLDTATLSLRHGASSDPEQVAAVNDLARHAVLDLERWRAPLSAKAYARRKPEQLGPRARDMLDTYGYPWVLDEFNFHITLADRFHDSSDETWVESLKRIFLERVTVAPQLSCISVCRESAPGEPMTRIAEFAL